MSNEKMKILEMVESKLISVDEGLKLLSAIDKIESSRIIPDDVKADVQGQINDALSEAHDTRTEAIEELSEELEEIIEEIEEEIEEIVEEIEDVYEEVSESVDEEAKEVIDEKVKELKDKAKDIKEKVKINVDINGEKFKKEFETSDFRNLFNESFKKDFENLKRGFKGDMKSFGKEAKRFGREMSKIARESIHINKDTINEVVSSLNDFDFSSLGGDFSEAEFKMEPDAETNNYNVEQEFTLDCEGKNHVSVNVVATDVNVVTEEREDILVNYIKYSSSDKDQFELVVEKDSKKILITEKHFGNKKFRVSGGNKELLIRLPRKYKESFSVKTISGDLDINYLDSDSFRFTSVSGDMTADIIYSVNTLVKTTSGDCEIGLFRGNMMFSSVSGDIDMKYEQLDGDFTMKNVSGDAEVSLPKNSEFEVVAKTLSGSLDCDFPITQIGNQKKGRLRGQVGSDAFKITASTTSGDLSINRY